MLHYAIPRRARPQGDQPPIGGRLRSERPGAALVALIERYDSWMPDADRDGTLMLLPGPARLCLPVGDGDGDGRTAVRIGARRPVTLDAPVLIAPTSLPVRIEATVSAAVSVVLITLTPAGLASIGGGDLTSNRMVPLTQIKGWALTEQLAAAAQDGSMRRLRCSLDVAMSLLVGDATLNAEEDAIVAGFGRLIDQGAVMQATEAAVRLDVPTHILRRTITRRFGFPPKMLLMRARFLRVLARMRDGERDVVAAIRGEYYDQSHFLRDGNRFLGMTPRRLLQSGVALVD